MTRPKRGPLLNRIRKMSHSPHKNASPVILFDSQRACGLPSDTHMRQRKHLSGSFQRTSACILFVVAVCMLLSHSAYALPHRENHAIHKEIEALEMEWRQAVIDNDVKQMDHLLADDYMGISANGTVETKAQALAQRRAGTVKISQLDLNDLKVRVYGDTAVVTSRADLAGSNGQSDIGGHYRYTRVYNRRLGQWKIVSFEASRIHDVDARSGKH
jgi:ketosteroid isomerase-like protein